MIKIAYSQTKSISPGQKNDLISCLTENARKRLESKKNGELYNQSLCAYLLLYKVLGKESFKKAGLSFTEQGKPYFENLDACVSLSHTKNFVACVVSDSKQKNVGIDIENNEIDSEKAKNLASRFFSEAEQKKLSKKIPFVEIWTKKEALFKSLDTELPFTSLDTEKITGLRFDSKQIDNSTLTVCLPKKSNAFYMIVI